MRINYKQFQIKLDASKFQKKDPNYINFVRSIVHIRLLFVATKKIYKCS
jgi:hypothetical protein